MKTISKKIDKKLINKCNFIDFDVRLLIERFWCTVGPQRIGKTSLNRAIFNTLYKKYGKSFLRETKQHIDLLNKSGYALEYPKHCFYSNHWSKLSKNDECHFCDFADLILPTSRNFDGLYFPYRSFIEIQEIDKNSDNRDWRNFDLNHKDFFKYYGHNGLTIGSDCQDYSNCDKKVRSLFTDILFVHHCERVKHWWQIKPRYYWYFYLKNNQLVEAMKELSQFSDVDIPVVRYYRFKYKGEIHDEYESLSAEPYFIRGLKKYKFKKNLSVDYDKKCVEKFCKKYPLSSVENVKEMGKDK